MTARSKSKRATSRTMAQAAQDIASAAQGPVCSDDLFCGPDTPTVVNFEPPPQAPAMPAMPHNPQGRGFMRIDIRMLALVLPIPEQYNIIGASYDAINEQVILVVQAPELPERDLYTPLPEIDLSIAEQIIDGRLVRVATGALRQN